MPAHINNFSYGWLTPVLAYAISFLGSFLGLLSTVRARAESERPRRTRWLLLAAWAIGGTGIWVMHFMAMIGFSVVDAPVRFNVPLTVASWLIAIVFVAAGLFVVGSGKPSAFKVIAAGIFTGAGVAAMHYTGMAAMQTSATVGYDSTIVAISVAIAIVACTVALWFTVTLRRPVAIAFAAAIMGIAVSGMHYTGMYALHLTTSTSVHEPHGITSSSFGVPILLFVIIVMLTLIYSLLNPAGPRVPEQAQTAPDGELRAGQPNNVAALFGPQARR